MWLRGVKGSGMSGYFQGNGLWGNSPSRVEAA
jgi:hypothetical protein